MAFLRQARSGIGGQVMLVAAWLTAAACAAKPLPETERMTVTVGVATAREQGPRAQVVGVGYLTTALVRENLVSIGPHGEIEPRLAEGWERFDEGRRWRFRLRKNVPFHDGTPLTSDIVISAMGRISAIGGVASIHRIDDHTFDVVQERASTFLLDALASVPIGAGTRAGGTGPFMSSEVEGDQIKFRAFDKHHQGAPSIKELALREFPDQRKAWAALMRGEIDVLYDVSPDAREFVETESTVAVSSFVRPYTYLLGFNFSHPSLKLKDVRRALNLAIDRREVIRTALRGNAEPAFDHLWPNHWAVDASRAAYEPNRAEAVRLLEAAGFSTLRRAGPERMPSRLAFTALVYEPLEKFALAMQRQLALIDVDMSVVLLPAPAMGQRIMVSRDYDAFLFELTNARVLGYTYTFWHSQSPESMRTGYAAADAALDRVRYAQTPEAVRIAVREVQDVMKDDPPAIFLAYPEVARAVSRRFALPGAQEDIFHSISRWTPARSN